MGDDKKRRTFPPPDAKTIHGVAFEVIEQCNLLCDFCVRNAHSGLKGIVAPAKFQKRVNTVAQQFGPLELIALTGGEPLLHPEIAAIVRIASGHARSFCVTTNATVMRQDFMDALREAGNGHVIVSLDGPDQSCHDAIRGKDGAYDRLVSFAEACGALGIRLLANVTVSERNHSVVYQTILRAAQIGARDISVALVKPMGRGKSSHSRTQVLTSTGRQIYQAQQSLSRTGVQVRFSEPLAHLFEVKREFSVRPIRCGAGSGMLHIQANGNVLLCTACSETIGNVDDVTCDLRDTWERDPRVLAVFEPERLGGSCGQCEFNRICAGCRCRAAASDDFVGGDPLCPRNVSPVQFEIASRTVAAAAERLMSRHARDEGELRRWLATWIDHENFSRDNRDFGAQLRWGHTWHLSNEEIVEGEMGERHMSILRHWIAQRILPVSLVGMHVLNVGPWTGGEAMLLAAMGAEVDVLEEAVVYHDTIAYLAQQFGLPVTVIGRSLYEMADTSSRGYDFVYLSGIVSHLSDPVVGLRIAFNQLRDGGACLVETQTSYALDGSDEFWGPSRPGWVWHNISRGSLVEMLDIAGFKEVEVVAFDKHRRVQLAGRRLGYVPLRQRMGLSHPGVK